MAAGTAAAAAAAAAPSVTALSAVMEAARADRGVMMVWLAKAETGPMKLRWVRSEAAVALAEVMVAVVAEEMDARMWSGWRRRW